MCEQHNKQTCQQGLISTLVFCSSRAWRRNKSILMKTAKKVQHLKKLNIFLSNFHTHTPILKVPGLITHKYKQPLTTIIINNDIPPRRSGWFGEKRSTSLGPPPLSASARSPLKTSRLIIFAHHHCRHVR